MARASCRRTGSTSCWMPTRSAPRASSSRRASARARASPGHGPMHTWERGLCERTRLAWPAAGGGSASRSPAKRVRLTLATQHAHDEASVQDSTTHPRRASPRPAQGPRTLPRATHNAGVQALGRCAALAGARGQDVPKPGAAGAQVRAAHRDAVPTGGIPSPRARRVCVNVYLCAASDCAARACARAKSGLGAAGGAAA